MQESQVFAASCKCTTRSVGLFTRKHVPSSCWYFWLFQPQFHACLWYVLYRGEEPPDRFYRRIVVTFFLFGVDDTPDFVRAWGRQQGATAYGQIPRIRPRNVPRNAGNGSDSICDRYPGQDIGSSWSSGVTLTGQSMVERRFHLSLSSRVFCTLPSQLFCPSLR